MVDATIEDLAFTNRSSRETIWGHPHIVGEDVLSTTFLKDRVPSNHGNRDYVAEIGN
jgi:hypothetical protein